MPDIPAELEAVAGPLKGNSIPLSDDEVSVGREPSNQISLLDAAVSRRHCVITHNAGQFKIQDLNSRNSTFVNGVPVTERALASGDEIKIGSSLFVFVVPESESAKDVSTSVEFDKTDPDGGSTIILRKQDARYLRDLVDIQSQQPHLADLNALLRISKAVNSVRGLEALEKQVLESIFEVAPADRAAILLCEHGLEEWTSVFGWDRRGRAESGGASEPDHRLAGAFRRRGDALERPSGHRIVLRYRQHRRAAHPQRAGRAARSLRPDPGSDLPGRLQSRRALRRESSATADRDRQHRRGRSR